MVLIQTAGKQQQQQQQQQFQALMEQLQYHQEQQLQLQVLLRSSIKQQHVLSLLHSRLEAAAVHDSRPRNWHRQGLSSCAKAFGTSSRTDRALQQ